MWARYSALAALASTEAARAQSSGGRRMAHARGTGLHVLSALESAVFSFVDLPAVLSFLPAVFSFVNLSITAVRTVVASPAPVPASVQPAMCNASLPPPPAAAHVSFCVNAHGICCAADMQWCRFVVWWCGGVSTGAQQRRWYAKQSDTAHLSKVCRPRFPHENRIFLTRTALCCVRRRGRTLSAASDGWCARLMTSTECHPTGPLVTCRAKPASLFVPTSWPTFCVHHPYPSERIFNQ